jgi:hypothetical protein
MALRDIKGSSCLELATDLPLNCGGRNDAVPLLVALGAAAACSFMALFLLAAAGRECPDTDV